MVDLREELTMMELELENKVHGRVIAKFDDRKAWLDKVWT